MKRSKQNQEPITITERNIVRETEKAILIQCSFFTMSGNIIAESFWCPKSQVLDMEIPAWLWKAKLLEVFKSKNLRFADISPNYYLDVYAETEVAS